MDGVGIQRMYRGILPLRKYWSCDHGRDFGEYVSSTTTPRGASITRVGWSHSNYPCSHRALVVVLLSSGGCSDMSYSVPHPSGDGNLELLSGISGFCKPGEVRGTGCFRFAVFVFRKGCFLGSYCVYSA